MPPLLINSPERIKKGTASRGKLSTVANIVCVTMSTLVRPVCRMNTVQAIRREKAMGTFISKHTINNPNRIKHIIPKLIPLLLPSYFSERVFYLRLRSYAG